MQLRERQPRSSYHGRPFRARAASCIVFVIIYTWRVSAALPIPPEMTLDIPVSEIPGVWRATRVAMLFGPTPAIWLYRKASVLAERAKPVVRRNLLHVAEKVHTWAYNHHHPRSVYRRHLTGGARMWKGHDTNSPYHQHEAGLRMSDTSAAALALGSGVGAFVPEPCMKVYLAIMRDPRLRRQRLRDSRIMIDGGLSFAGFRNLYRDYRRTLNITLQVAKGWSPFQIHFQHVHALCRPTSAKRQLRTNKNFPRPSSIPYTFCQRLHFSFSPTALKSTLHVQI